MMQENEQVPEEVSKNKWAPIIGAGIAILFAFVIFGYLISASKTEDSRASKIASGKILSDIRNAILFLNIEGNEVIPQTLQEIVEKTIYPLKSIESPRKPADFEGPSYILVGNQKTLMPPDTIVAYENPGYCTNGINVLFMNGSVKWMELDDFLVKLETTYKRLRREMPEVHFMEED